MSRSETDPVALAKRWAETALSGAVLAIMLWVGGRMIWNGVLIGVVILIVAIGAGYWFRTALARARLAPSPLGAGVVEVDERRITYWGPESGAFVALDALTGVDVLAGSKGVFETGPAWVLRPAEGPPLVVPTGARGADQLFETFAALPGFSYDRAVAAMRAPEGTRTEIWRLVKGNASALASRPAPD